MIQYLTILLEAKKSKMDERGASAVEYGLLVAGIAAIIVIAVFAFGGLVSGIFNDTSKAISNKGGTN
ncbi:Flp family type IVb pilin [Nocardioides campestrisoli]|uniref:Flp family type IVb pilin n=1 Tax=Nocardioides campestrisoli TaxID=2736757 RepID=UPI00163D455D|nr:Flp family type IVb pilin [Nocardioides campestrisoli]